MRKVEAGVSGTLAPAPYDRAHMRLYDDVASKCHRRSNQRWRGVKAIAWTFCKSAFPRPWDNWDRSLGPPPKIADQRGTTWAISSRDSLSALAASTRLPVRAWPSPA